MDSELLRDQGILTVSPTGPLSEEDFARLAREVDPIIAANGKLTGLMICVNAFPGWDGFGALIAHLKFVQAHHRNIDRIAAVTDSAVLKTVTQLSKMVVSPAVRQFPFDQKTAALAWLEGAGAKSATAIASHVE